MSSNTNTRRTQAERRAQSRQAVLDSGCRQFGDKGYASTSLEEIAADCGMTIRPIFHYFGNKKALFAAVNEVMEQRIIDSIQLDGSGASMLDNWRAYLALCDDPAFRRIVLIDGPNILGRERWATSPVMQKARAGINNAASANKAGRYRTTMLVAMVMGALTEAALMIAAADDIDLAKQQAELLMRDLFDTLAV